MIIKSWVVLILCVSVCVSVTTTEWDDCLQKRQAEENFSCTGSCLEDFEEDCGPDSDVWNQENCTYQRDNIEALRKTPLGLSREWSEDLGEKFHGCWDDCKDELSGDAEKWAEILKECNANILRIGMYGVLLLIMFLI